MALTRSMLKAMSIEDEKVDQIIEAHSETVEALKAQRAELEAKAAKADALEEQVEQLKAAQPTKDWESEYNSLKEEYEGYKADIVKQRAEEEKAELYRAALREAGVDEKRIPSIMKVTDLSGIEVADGKLSDAEAVAQTIADEWGEFVVKTAVVGAQVDNPPSTSSTMTKDDIKAIKDPQARQQAIAQNIELFR